MHRQSPYDEPPKRKSVSGRSRLMEYAFTITVGVALFMIFVLLVVSGDRMEPNVASAGTGRVRGAQSDRTDSVPRETSGLSSPMG